MLLGVTNARAKVGSIQATPELVNDPQAFAAVPAGAGRAVVGAVAPAGGGRELSAAQVRRELPRPAGAARGHREPHRGRAQPLHQGGAGIQHRRCVQFPTNLTAMVFGFKEKPQFTVENEKEISKAPKVDFGKPPRPRHDPAPSKRHDRAHRCRELLLAAALLFASQRCGGGGRGSAAQGARHRSHRHARRRPARGRSRRSSRRSRRARAARSRC